MLMVMIKTNTFCHELTSFIFDVAGKDPILELHNHILIL